MSIPTDRDLLVKASGNLLNAANGVESLNPTLARRLAAAVINDQSFGVDYLSRTQMQVESLAGAQQVAVPPGWADLLRQSRRNYLNQFGASTTADWVYTDLIELFEGAAPQPAAYVPLTDYEIKEMAVQEQILLFCDGIEELTAVVRAVEARMTQRGKT